jgi:hypothetical protein
MRRHRTLFAVACGLLLTVGLVVSAAPGCGEPESFYTNLGCPNSNGTYDPGCCGIFGLGCDAPCYKPGADLVLCCEMFDYCQTAPQPWIDGGAYSDCLMWASWGCPAPEGGDGGDSGTDGDVDSGDLDGAAE